MAELTEIITIEITDISEGTMEEIEETMKASQRVSAKTFKEKLLEPGWICPDDIVVTKRQYFINDEAKEEKK